MKRVRVSLLMMFISCLALGLIGCGAAATNTTPTPVSGSPEAEAGQSPPMVTGVSASLDGDRTRVVVHGTQSLEFTADYKEVPPTIVMDVQAEAAPEAVGLKNFKTGIVKSVDIAPRDDNPRMLRVRVDLFDSVGYEVVREGADLVILAETGDAELYSLDGLTPAQVRGLARITGVDFVPMGKTGRTRLVIQTSKPITPQILTKNNGRTVILSISPAVISRHMARPLNTTYYRSSVDHVQTSQRKGRTVQFMVKLRETVPYHLGQKGLTTYVDFDASMVPPDQANADLRGGKGAAEDQQGGDQVVPASAEGGEGTTVVAGQAGKTYTGPKVSLDFKDADVHNIIRLLAEVGGKNVFVSEDVQGKVTLKLTEVPWDQALDMVLATQKLGMVESGNVLRVDTSENISKEKALLAEEARKEAERQKEAPLVKKVFSPKYAAVGALKNEMAKLSTPDRGKIEVIGNDIYVRDEQSIIDQMQLVFEKNDIVAKQILIEARIVEARSNFAKNLGINWGGTGEVEADPLVDGNDWNIEGAVNLIEQPASGLSLGFGLVNSVLDLNAQLYAMEQTGEGRIISAPRVMASNDEQVHISQGTSVPYESSDQNGTKVEFQEAVLKLQVTPHIETNGEIITMDILVTKDSPDYAVSTRNPPINKNEAKTKLMVKNGETVVIGGIIVDEKAKAVNRVPGMHSIPLLGWMFKNYEVTDSKTELLIFLTSNIIPVQL